MPQSDIPENELTLPFQREECLLQGPGDTVLTDENPVTETWRTLPTPIKQPNSSACLVFIYPHTASEVGTRFPLPDVPATIGRVGACAIVICHPSISRNHAKMLPAVDGHYITDLGSTNGTLVNEQATSLTKLKDGDYIRLGECVLRYLASGNVEAEYHEEIRTLAVTDALTALYNKRHVLEELDREISRSFKHGLALSLLLIDIDHFKSINDRLGHLGGDLILRELAALLRDTLRKGDLVGRYGGEEFILILPVTPKEGAVRLGERLRRAVESRPFKFGNVTQHITISLGSATVMGNEEVNVAEFIRRADQNLYRAKKDGRNRLVSEDLECPKTPLS